MDDETWVEEINILYKNVQPEDALLLKKIYEGLPNREVQVGVVLTLLWAHFLQHSTFNEMRKEYRYVWDNNIFNSDRKFFYSILVDVLFHGMRNSTGRVYNLSRAMDLTLANISNQSATDRLRQNYARIDYLLQPEHRTLATVRVFDDDDRDSKRIRERPPAPGLPSSMLPVLKAPVDGNKSIRMTPDGIAEPRGWGWHLT